ncbi:hypothetical protein J7E25_13460 [Agromyces sp. ISL-38]|uniref:hypothetical protein n=1 Tax=Agromyces sp. ISL-38 TaxID=2819107 RepID=UPI001BEBB296|nr:hypothetical protein [Agromyces sp. ISL-38]MBT2500094.1 hypothetical protein [Agromyces sp. ISL-38]
MSEYRATLRLASGQDAIRIADEQMRSWLRTKLKTVGRGTLDTVDWEGPGTHDLGPEASLGVARADSSDGTARRQLLRFTEVNEHGEWVVSLYAINAARDSSIVVRATGPQWVAPPRVVGQILEVADVRDAGTRVFKGAHLVHESDLDALVDYVRSVERRNALVVAPSPGVELEETWRAIVDSLTSQSAGIATVYVVPDRLLAALDGALPPSHRVEAGRVRTFLPDVDLDSLTDAYRHRVLGPVTLTRAIRGRRVADSLQQVHAGSIRAWSLDDRLPGDLRRAVDQLDKDLADIRRAELVDAMIQADSTESAPAEDETSLPTETEPTGPTVGSGLSVRRRDRLARFVRRWLGRDHSGDEDIDELDAILRRQVKELELTGQQAERTKEQIERLESELDELRRRYEDSELDAAVEADNARRIDWENQVLRRRLKEAGRYEDLYVEPDSADWSAPESMLELVLRLQPGERSHIALERVEFSGDIDFAAEVDARDPIGRYAARMWDYVRVLYDYATLKATSDFRGTVHAYLTDDSVAGTKCSPQRHAGTESDAVVGNRRLRDQRSFPVPAAVLVEERAPMYAHFKPTHSDTFAPRLHYYDDTTGTGKVYIGYIGRHLENTRTN